MAIIASNKNIYSFDELLKIIKTYIRKEEDIDFVTRAFLFAKEKHANQFRKSGEPYITHCIAVTAILAQYQSAPSTLAAGFLHDTMEDCNVTYQELKTTFNDDVAEIVQAVTKIKRLPDVSVEETSASTHRKLILAMAKDIRAVIVKLCDRLHNMRTLDCVSNAHQLKVSKETLEVYAPLAHRLGMSDLKNELENLCLYYLNPEEYQITYDLIQAKNTTKVNNIGRIISTVSKELDKQNFKYRIFGRNKHLYSVYKKMYVKHVPFEQIYDLQAIRIVCQTKLQCYEILGIIHTIYKPIPGRFKDYIAMPKTNMYQSLHTTVMDGDGNLFEIQIRTEDMDYIASRGIAAHWTYKENYSDQPSKTQALSEQQLSWLRDLIKINEESEDKSDVEYMKQVQKDILETSIYVLTPNGKIIDMPSGSTPVDFAYRVHTAVGNQCVGAIVNQLMVPLSTELKSGDIVEIKTKNGATPSEDWLNFVKTSTARSQIKKFFIKKQAISKQAYDEQVSKKGQTVLEDVLRQKGLNAEEIYKQIDSPTVLKYFDANTRQELLIKIGQKSISVQQVLNQISDKNVDFETQLDIFSKRLSAVKRKTYKGNIYVKGASGIKIEPAVCCHPIPGDKIIGFITRGAGVKVHRVECKNLQKESNRLIEASWAENIDAEADYPVALEITSYDRGNLVIDIMGLFASLKIKVDSMNARSHYENKTATFNCTVHVHDVAMLNVITARIKQINGIIDVNRKMK